MDLIGQYLSWQMRRDIPVRRKLNLAKRFAGWPYRAVRTHYGPVLENAGNDRTYLKSIAGTLGDFIPGVLASKKVDFTFLDIGANTGIFSLLAARLPNCHKVVAFEPNPSVFARLQRSAELNEATITAFCLALSSTGQTAAVFHTYEGHSGCGTLEAVGDGSGEIHVATADARFLDSLSEQIVTPVVCKIDVEGHERHVLEALFASKLAGSVSDIIIECAQEHHSSGLEDIFLDLEARGFEYASRGDSPTYHDRHYTRALQTGGAQ